MSEEEQVRTADHFPRVLKPCKRAAAPFFTCLTDKSKQPEGGDPSATQKALNACKTFMAEYDACMIQELKKGQKRDIYRVPEVYRDRK